MNDINIVTPYSVIEDLLTAYGYEDDVRSTVSAAEIPITVIASCVSITEIDCLHI